MTPQDHNKALGITHLAYGGFHLLLTAGVAFFLLILSVPQRGEGDAAILPIFMSALIAISLLFTLPSLIAGFALLRHKSWARTAAIVAGIMATPSFPYGTALGVYTLWFMFGHEGKNFYATGAAGAWSKPHPDALPGMPAGNHWAKDSWQKPQEREYVPPPQMPNWR